MIYSKPSYLVQGEPARLFPVLAVTSKEGRTTSIILACMVRIEELCSELLSTTGKKIGKRSKVETFTEVVFPKQDTMKIDRPDGLIVVRTGKSEWRALVEAKVGTAILKEEQVEKYRELAKMNDVDCVITISNQFTTSPEHHPLVEVRKSRSRIPVFHWSWMSVLTAADLLLSNENVEDVDQRLILAELSRFLKHESAGVRGFDRMPAEWTSLNRLVSSGGKIPARSNDADAVLEAWHQETRDLSLILSRLTEAAVSEKLTRNHSTNPTLRRKDELAMLREYHQLRVSLVVPHAAAPLEIYADLKRRCIDVGMHIQAPGDRKSSKARLRWILTQIKSELTEDIHIRLSWPGSSEDTQFSLQQLRDNADIIDEGKSHLQVREFFVFLSKRTGSRFTQQLNFIADLEEAVPNFYAEVGSALSVWKPKAPKIKLEKTADENAIDIVEPESESGN